MKRDGFSLVEVLIAIFVFASIVFFVFPLQIVEKTQVEKIAEWKEFYPSLAYSYDLFNTENSNIVKAYENDVNLNSDAYFLEFAKYLDLKKTQNLIPSKYKMYYLNRKIIQNSSKYKINEIFELADGKIVAFTDLERDKDNLKDAPLGIIFIDVDGSKRNRHFIGKDVFAVNLYADRIEPVGKKFTRQEMKEDCSPIGTGLNCSAYYLFGGVM